MQLLVQNSNMQSVDVLDVFESLIWTDRYSKFGDFELYSEINEKVLNGIRKSYYLSIKESDRTMIVEALHIDSDVERGNKLVVKGRSLESILDRRIVWYQTVLNEGLQDGIERLLYENAIAPIDPDRKISRLVFEPSTDPNILGLTIKGQYTGDNIYDVVQKICDSESLGFKITLSPTGMFIFKLYFGEDRSYEQVSNSYVVFSPKFDNIINSTHIDSDMTLRTVALVLGEGEGSSRLGISVPSMFGSGSDLDRRELYTDARDISRTTSGGTLSEAAYLELLSERGFLDLLDHLPTEIFEGSADANQMFKYGVDFNIGDIVQSENEYGQAGRTRVTEVTHSQNDSGINIYPTFTTI